jgi:hypothetical protein
MQLFASGRAKNYDNSPAAAIATFDCSAPLSCAKMLWRNTTASVPASPSFGRGPLPLNICYIPVQANKHSQIMGYLLGFAQQAGSCL